MASDHVPTRFLSLPNEVIYHIFKYLSPIDLIVSFDHLRNHRLQQLLASSISSLNLHLTDSTSLAWFDQHCAVAQQYVKRVVIDVEFVEELLGVIPKLDALTVFYDDDTQHCLDWFVAHFQTMIDVHVGVLTLSTYAGIITTNTANILLDGNGRLPQHTLNVMDTRLQLDLHNLPSHSQLRHLNCILQDEAMIHALLARLPKLETIKVGLFSNGLEMESNILENVIFVSVSSVTDTDSDDASHVFLSKYKPKENAEEINVVAPPHLRSISITGHIANFDHLSRLFQLASASLKSIKLKVLAYSIIDPDQMNRVAHHIDFDFRIDYRLIRLPSDFDWKSYIDAFLHRPVLRCEDKVFCCLSSVINRSVFWLQTPKIFVTSPHILCFPQVHTLKFQYCRFTIDTNTVKFIQETFPSMNKLIWRLPPPRVTSKIPLDMVNTLVMHSEDHQTLQGLLLLCPNVTCLHFTRDFEQVEESLQLNEKQVQNVCEQMKRVKLIPKDESKLQSAKKLFPNAEVTCDAKPFYEQMF